MAVSSTLLLLLRSVCQQKEQVAVAHAGFELIDSSPTAGGTRPNEKG